MGAGHENLSRTQGILGSCSICSAKPKTRTTGDSPAKSPPAKKAREAGDGFATKLEDDGHMTDVESGDNLETSGCGCGCGWLQRVTLVKRI